MGTLTWQAHAKSVAASEAGALGAWGALAGMIGGVVLGLSADRLRRKKGLLMLCCAGGAAAFGVFALVCGKVIEVPREGGRLLGVLYATSILGTIFINSTIPLFYEMAVRMHD